jgi:hypothetical protein
MGPVTTPSRDPFAETDRLLIDGTNLLHVLSRQPGTAAPRSALVGRIRAVVPAAIGIELVFDGMPDRGMRGERVASGLIVRYSGRRTADALLLSLVDEARSAVGPTGTARLLVVSDDRALRAGLQQLGARTAGCAWLVGRLDRPRLAAPSVGNRRPPVAARPPDHESDQGEARSSWKPGRGATRKKGNPRRGHPSSGRMPE